MSYLILKSGLKFISTCLHHLQAILASMKHTLWFALKQNAWKYNFAYLCYEARDKKKCIFLWDFFTDRGLEWSKDWIYASILVSITFPKKNGGLGFKKKKHFLKMHDFYEPGKKKRGWQKNCCNGNQTHFFFKLLW